MQGSSWLLADDMDRQRMLDMDGRIAPLRKAALAVLGVALIAGGPWLGWWTLFPLGVAALLFRGADALIDRVERPEYLLFAAWAGSQVVIAVSVVISGAPDVATVSWLALPVVTLPARFSTRGTVVGVAFSLVLLLAVTVGADAGAVWADPPLLLAPAALIVAVALLSAALMQSDIEHRSEAVLDPLTQLLNRNALEGRVRELAQQSELTGEPVGVVLGDVDEFKRINDSRGHAEGDAALRDVAYVVRKQLRAFDLVYRIGGEEFLVLLPGAGCEAAVEVAERLRTAVESACAGVTMSFGVSGTRSGESLEWTRVFEQADAALYAAKRGGRNQVMCDALGDPPAGEPVAAA